MTWSQAAPKGCMSPAMLASRTPRPPRLIGAMAMILDADQAKNQAAAGALTPTAPAKAMLMPMNSACTAMDMVRQRISRSGRRARALAAAAILARSRITLPPEGRAPSQRSRPMAAPKATASPIRKTTRMGRTNRALPVAGPATSSMPTAEMISRPRVSRRRSASEPMASADLSLAEANTRPARTTSPPATPGRQRLAASPARWARKAWL